ncbi:sulfatase family protein [Haloarcula salina]|uniref:Sulfatase-like hydrolase/transferase n=1 Tax=Haloarcula salina TaxID=1429914 RepID=A0AA41KM44_9EURY|nr:sulfatase [Haloarcula salina]MBV0903519.1 sulfatase-like hydrolase/transferase [Haloarcula salina]
MTTIFIDIDSLRPDHVGAYGYDAPTTPNIDAMASDGVVFERAYCANSPCIPSRAGTITGRYGIDTGVETHGRASQQLNHPATMVDWAGGPSEAADLTEWYTLPELFYERDRTAVGIGSFPQHPAPWFYHIWDEYHQPKSPDTDDFQAIEAEYIIERALDTLDRLSDEDLYLYVQMWDPHTPYNRTEEEIEPFRSADIHPYPTQADVERHQEWDAWRSASHMDIEDRSDLNEMLSRYDAEIRHADEQVGRLIDRLKSLGLYDDATIVLTGDHGEEFGEHGLYREHWSTHDGTQHVPLIVKPPSDESRARKSRPELVTNVDIAPTIAEYEGLDRPSRWQGRSLRGLVNGSADDWRDYIVVDHGLYTAQRAVRTDRWKYIRTYHAGMWDGVVPAEQLFDMENDPWEQDNVLDDHEDVVAELRGHLEEWVETHGGDDDPLQTVASEGPSGYNVFKDDWDGI